MPKFCKKLGNFLYYKKHGDGVLSYERIIQGLIPSGQLEVLKFYNKISARIDSEIFHNFGSDIQGGCGQLKQTMVV